MFGHVWSLKVGKFVGLDVGKKDGDLLGLGLGRVVGVDVGSLLGDIDGIADGRRLGRVEGNELGLEDGGDDRLAVGVTVGLRVVHCASSRSSDMQALCFMLNIIPSPQSCRYVTNPSSQKSISLQSKRCCIPLKPAGHDRCAVSSVSGE